MICTLLFEPELGLLDNLLLLIRECQIFASYDTLKKRIGTIVSPSALAKFDVE